MATVTLGSQPGGPRSATKIKIELIARYRVAGVKNSKIAEIMGITEASLGQILQLPEYKETEEAILLGVTSKMDEALAGRGDIIRATMRTGVPAALRCLLDAVNQRRDLRTALAAAGEILDRDPDKTLLKPKDKVASGEIDENSLPDAIWNAAVAQGDKVADVLKTPKEKSN